MGNYQLASSRSLYFDSVSVRPPLDNDLAETIANEVIPSLEAIRHNDDVTDFVINTLRYGGRRDSYAARLAGALLYYGHSAEVLAEHFPADESGNLFEQIEDSKQA